MLRCTCSPIQIQVLECTEANTDTRGEQYVRMENKLPSIFILIMF